MYYTENMVKDYYDSTIKIRKNGDIILIKYDKPILFKNNNFVNADMRPIIKKKPKTKAQYEAIDKIISIDKELAKMNGFGNLIDYYNYKIKKSIDTKKDLRSESEESSIFCEIRHDSLIRTRNLLIDYSCENADKFKTFITLTFKEDIKDVYEANKQLNKYLTSVRRDMKKKGREFYYLGVPEFQKNGRVHYHLLTSLENDIDIPKKNDLKTYNPFKDVWYVHNYYEIPHWTYGYSDSFDILKNTDDNFNLSLYLIKYLYKDIDNRLFGNKKILKSNNLDKPNIYKLKQSSTIYKNAVSYINQMNDEKKDEKKIAITYRNRVEKINDRGYSIKYDVERYTSQADYSILKEILKDDLEL